VSPDPSAHQNHLLDALPATDYQRVASHLELILLGLGDVLYQPRGRLRYAHFLTTAIISLLYVMEDGASTEVAIVGNEGMLEISQFMSGDTTPGSAVLQSAGHAFRLCVELLKDEFGRFGPAMHLLLRCTQALITRMAQTAVCNRHHSIDQQLCRWLLLSLDRLGSSVLSMTQELIANMLGVRREGVTEAAGKLQDAGLIHYRRGTITVVDRPGLETRAGGPGLRVLPGGQDRVRSSPALRRKVAPRDRVRGTVLIRRAHPDRPEQTPPAPECSFPSREKAPSQRARQFWIPRVAQRRWGAARRAHSRLLRRDGRADQHASAHAVQMEKNRPGGLRATDSPAMHACPSIHR